MARIRGCTTHGDAGLSEVIGFVIIFGILVILFSNYMLYGIPAQGRDSEIAHMNDVKDQFVDFKVGLDSLFNNNKVGTTLSDSFTLGTGGSYSTGANSIIPIMSPIKSSGTIAINQRTTEPETLTMLSDSLIQSASAQSSTDIPASGTPIQFNYRPSHIYVTISGIQASDLAKDKIFGVTVNGPTWIATINLTPQQSFYVKWTMPSPIIECTPDQLTSGAINVRGAFSERGCFIPENQYTYASTDLQISISKNNVSTLQNYPIYKTVQVGTTYTIDLMDDSYGLKSLIQPPGNISLTKQMGSISATGNITYAFAEMPQYRITPIPLGALEYRAQNNYWISQDYYYQLGGIFIAQYNQSSTYKLPPEITFSYDAGKNLTTVNINALVFDQSSRGIVGGNSPVQVKTMLVSNNAFPYVTGTANTKWIRINISTTDSGALVMWKNYFNYTAMAAGVPNTLSGNTTTESFILINGSDNLGDTYDINVIAANATFSTTIHGIGGT